MATVRRAILLSTADRNAGLIISFVQVAAISRLLTPEEIGVAALGTAIMGFALAMREFASPGFLMQPVELSESEIRTSFTVLLLLTLLIAAAFCTFAPWLAARYASDQLTPFIRVVSIAVLLEALALPLKTVIWREMQFGRLAIINVGCIFSGSLASIGFGAIGLSSLSLAWGWFVGSITTLALCLFFRPHLWLFRPSFRHWRRAVAFGGYSGLVTLLNKSYEMLPYLILGRMISLEAVGQYNRAVLLRDLVDKLVIAGVTPAALPAFAAEVRAGRSLADAYLRALAYISVVQWPALMLTAVLAHPAVMILLGPQWLEIVPLVHVMAPASLFACPALLTYPALVAIGAMRYLLLITSVTMPVSILIFYCAASYGLHVAAASMLIIMPFQFTVTICMLQRILPFTWGDVARAFGRSLLVTGFSIAPAIAVVAATGFRFDLPTASGVMAGLMAVPGWLLGLRLTRHPFIDEIRRTGDWIAASPHFQVISQMRSRFRVD